MNASNVATVGIVDNDPLVAKALEDMFTNRPTPLQVMWSVCDGREALSLCSCDAMRPEVIFTDLQMPAMSGKDLANRITTHWSNVLMIGITAFNLTYTRQELIEAGIKAVLRKEASVQEYVQTVGLVTGKDFLRTWEERSLAASRMLLTDTEIAVLREYLKGRTTSSVARLLHMSEGTVKSHMNNAYSKMGVHSRIEAIKVCIQEGLL